jgi:hypothetical protein
MSLALKMVISSCVAGVPTPEARVHESIPGSHLPSHIRVTGTSEKNLNKLDSSVKNRFLPSVQSGMSPSNGYANPISVLLGIPGAYPLGKKGKKHEG